MQLPLKMLNILDSLPRALSEKGNVCLLWTFIYQSLKTESSEQNQEGVKGLECPGSLLLHFAKMAQHPLVDQLQENDLLTMFESALEILEGSFMPFVVLLIQRCIFYSRVQKGNETPAEYLRTLESLAQTCEFESNGELVLHKIREQFKWGLKPDAPEGKIEKRGSRIKLVTNSVQPEIVEKRLSQALSCGENTDNIAVENNVSDSLKSSASSEQTNVLQGSEINTDADAESGFEHDMEESDLQTEPGGSSIVNVTSDKQSGKSFLSDNAKSQTEMNYEKSQTEMNYEKSQTDMMNNEKSQTEMNNEKSQTEMNNEKSVSKSNSKARGKKAKAAKKAHKGKVSVLKFKKPPSQSYKCTICKEIFATSNELKKHRKQHSHNCKECSMDFTSAWALGRHMKAVHNKCPICGEIVTKLSSHMRMHKEKDCTCEKCGKTFRLKSLLKQHLETHDKNRSTLTCEYCGKLYLTLSSLRRHKGVHTNPYKCEICGKLWGNKSDFNTHMLFHKGEKNYACEYCGQSFVVNSALLKHVREQHGPGIKKPHKCEICGSAFAQPSFLKYHMSSHSTEKPFKCDQCPSVFKRMQSLQRHMRSHSGVKPHQCDVCQKEFHFRSGLVLHKERQHSEPGKSRPYTCSVCEKGFLQLSMLKSHMVTHSKDRPFQCNECNAEFGRRAHLNRHMATQHGEKRFKCDICQLAFTYRNLMLEHRKSHDSKITLELSTGEYVDIEAEIIS